MGLDGVSSVVMAALTLARYLQDTTGISIARIVRELRGLQEVTINLNSHRITAQPQLTQTATSILKSLKPQDTKASGVRPESHL